MKGVDYVDANNFAEGDVWIYPEMSWDIGNGDVIINRTNGTIEFTSNKTSIILFIRRSAEENEPHFLLNISREVYPFKSGNISYNKKHKHKNKNQI